jgi:D-3-phosphoglycerate dehydrogenase / 2-oxoglutarate reductase
MKLLNTADISACPDLFSPLKGICEVTHLPPDKEEVMARIGEFDAYFSSLKLIMDKEILSCANKLKFIATPSTGSDHLDLQEAGKMGIRVITLKDETEFLDKIPSTAELAWTLLLSVMRRIPECVNASSQGNWGRDEFRGHQIAGKTLGILGYGRLGRIVAEYGKAFRMRVITHDIKNVTPANGVEVVDFATLLAESDVLSLHIHLNKYNEGLLSWNEFNAMKPGVTLINTSRGAIINEEAFLDALGKGKVSAAGLDVVHGEWSDDLKNHPLIVYERNHDNLIITPHVGGTTYEAQLMAYSHTVHKLKKHLISKVNFLTKKTIKKGDENEKERKLQVVGY